MLVKTIKNISEEDYNKLLKCSKEEIYEFVLEIANNSMVKPCAYGFYSPRFFEENGRYFVSWERWDSCD